MADKKNSTALATMDSFAIANRYEGIDPELLAELQDEMGDLDPESGITCRQIKVPSGGGIAYEVQGEEEGDADPMKEILGVIVFTHRLSGYWPGSFGSAKDAKDKMKYMADQGLIGFSMNKGNRKKDYSVLKWFVNRSSRFVEFYIGKLSKAGDPVDDAEELAEARSIAAQPEWEQQHFTPIDGEDEELPF